MARERGLRLVCDALGEGCPVPNDLLHCQRTDDRAQGPGEGLLGEGLDLPLLGEEALGGRPDRVLVAPDLDQRHTVEVELDALAGDRPADLDHDPTARQIQDMQPLHERHDEDAPTHDDLLPG